MFDAIRIYVHRASERSSVLTALGVTPGRYLLATIHRPYNTDRPETLSQILETLLSVDESVVFPVHPRTRKRIDELGSSLSERLRNSKVKIVDPVGYLDMLELQQHARLILTDSGGVQKEAYILGIPCITLRPETEWVETVEAGWNTLAGADPQRIYDLVKTPVPADRPRPQIFGDGFASRRIVELLN
jgi:UDP-N-acetylglucosamine 2-epimerase